MSGIRAVAAPIFDHTGAAVGALGLSVPAVRMDDERVEQLGQRAKEVAWEVSETLGATPAVVEETLELARGRQRRAPAAPPPGTARGRHSASR